MSAHLHLTAFEIQSKFLKMLSEPLYWPVPSSSASFLTSFFFNSELSSTELLPIPPNGWILSGPGTVAHVLSALWGIFHMRLIPTHP